MTTSEQTVKDLTARNLQALIHVTDRNASQILCFMHGYMHNDERFQKTLAEKIAEYSVNPICQVVKN